jgi:hypothetical protein
MRILEAIHAMCSRDLFKIAIEWYIKSYFSVVQHSVLCVNKVVTRKMRRVLNILQQTSKLPASPMKGENVKIKVELSRYTPCSHLKDIIFHT